MSLPRDRSDGQGRPTQPQPASGCAPSATRRDVIRQGAKLAYLTPIVFSLSAQQALAASIPSGMCSTGQQTGEPCFTDTDCCSGKCDFGVCT
jgi:hypothetical protein